MKYIDSEKLVAKLTKMQFTLNAAYRKPQSDNIVRAISLEYDDIFSLIDSLQSEQPDADLNEETIINEFHVIRDKCFNEGIEGWEREKLIARHFYELKLKLTQESND